MFATTLDFAAYKDEFESKPTTQDISRVLDEHGIIDATDNDAEFLAIDSWTDLYHWLGY